MKQSAKKLTRGQMVYAPIAPTQNRSKSPFSQSKKNLVGSKSHLQPSHKQLMHQSSQSRVQHSPQSPYTAYDPSVTFKQSASPFHEYQQQLQQLVKENSELKARQQIYITKLFKLQQGFEKQHEEFMNLQELYNELFNVYKQKEEEIAQLEIRYKETERSRIDFSSHGKRQQNGSVMSIDKMNSVRQTVLQQNFRHQLAQLIFQNKRLNQTNEKLMSELNYLKSKEKLNDSRHTLQQKVFNESTDWQKQADLQKEQKIKLEYENRFFKMRNQDLQKTITELQKIISNKQTEIIKMREEKFANRRKSSQKVLNKSPPRSNVDSARSKGSNQQNSKKYVKLIENLQKENHRLREQNLLLKEKLKGNIFQKQTVRLQDSFYNNGSQHHINQRKRLQFSDEDNRINSNSVRGYQNENFNSQNLNQQYFSFSRQKEDKQSEEDLPTFPMDLEIEGIIKKHEEFKKVPQHIQRDTEGVQASV